MWYSPADEAEIVGTTYATYPFDTEYFFFVDRKKKIREMGSRKSKEKNRRVVCIQGSLEFDFDCMVFSFSFFLLSFLFFFLTPCIFSKHKRRHRGYRATLSATIHSASHACMRVRHRWRLCGLCAAICISVRIEGVELSSFRLRSDIERGVFGRLWQFPGTPS